MKDIREVVAGMSEKARYVRVLDNEANALLERFMSKGDIAALEMHKGACERVGVALKEFNELHERYLKEGYKFYVYRDRFTAIPQKVLAA